MVTMNDPRPSSADAPASHHRRWPLSLLSILFTLLLLAGTWAAVWIELRHERATSLRTEGRQNVNLAHVLAEQTLRVLNAADQITLRLRDMVRTQTPDIDLARLASETGLSPHILVQLSLVGPDGRFLGSNIDPDASATGPVDLSEREHIRVHLAANAPPVAGNGLFIGKPVLGKVSRRWTIQLSRRIDGADGQILGVVVASLDPGYFEEVYRNVALGSMGGVTLVGRDLSIRARVIGGESQGMSTVMESGGSLDRPETGVQGHGVALSGVDKVERVHAYHQVGDYPLYVMVATATEEALADWRNNRDMMLIMAALVSVAVVGAAGVFQISLRRLERGNEALRISEAQARSANQAKSAFLIGASQLLRKPLADILGLSDLLERRLDNPRWREMARVIHLGAKQLDEQLADILDLARVEAGAMPIETRREPLLALTQGCADARALQAQTKNLPLRVRIGPEVPVHLVCDGARVRQVLDKLLANAIQYTERGSVALEVDSVPGHVRFHVADTGPGILADQQDRVFEHFRTAGDNSSSSDADNHSTGLGLALARGLAERMGGTLTLQSTPGAGSRFTLSLPILAEAKPPPAQASA